VAGALYACFVKGVFALLAPVLAGLWLWTRRSCAGGNRIAWAGLACLAAVVPLAAWGYEHAYLATTGQSFLDYYLGARIALEGGTSSWPFPLDKVYNALWYAGRVLWYSAPWSVVVVAACVPAVRAGVASPSRDWIWFALTGTLATVALVAARDTMADRYIFPAYFLAASAGVVLACARWPQAATLADRLDRTWPWGPAVLWLLLVVGRIVL